MQPLAANEKERNGESNLFFVAIVNYTITLGFFFLFKCLWLNPRSGLPSRISQSILPICREASDFCVCHLHLSRCWHSGRVFIFKATHGSGVGHPPSPVRNATGGNHHWSRAAGLGSLSLWALSLSFRIFFGIFPFLCMFTPAFNYHCWWDLHLALLRAALTLELPPFLQLLRAARPGTWELVRKTFKGFLLLGKFRKPEQFLCIQMSHNHPMHGMIKTIVTRKATCPKIGTEWGRSTLTQMKHSLRRLMKWETTELPPSQCELTLQTSVAPAFRRRDPLFLLHINSYPQHVECAWMSSWSWHPFDFNCL